MAIMSLEKIIELILRILAIVMSVGALIAAAISLDELMDITNGPFSDIVTGIIEVASADLLQTTAAAAAVAIVSVLIIPMESLMIVLRLLKLKKLGIFAQVIAIMDVIVIFLATAGFGVAGILASIAAKNWSDDVLDRIRNVPIAFPFNIDVATSEVIDIRNGMAATAAMSFLAFGSGTILFFFVLLLLVKSKNLDYIAKS